jgi:hypothetical protein
LGAENVIELNSSEIQHVFAANTHRHHFPSLAQLGAICPPHQSDEERETFTFSSVANIYANNKTINFDLEWQKRAHAQPISHFLFVTFGLFNKNAFSSTALPSEERGKLCQKEETQKNKTISRGLSVSEVNTSMKSTCWTLSHRHFLSPLPSRRKNFPHQSALKPTPNVT